MPQKLPPLNIKDPEAYRLAREISGRTGESLTEVVRKSAPRSAFQGKQPHARSGRDAKTDRDLRPLRTAAGCWTLAQMKKSLGMTSTASPG